MSEKQAVYACVNRACPSKGVEWRGIPPAEYRAATGSPVLCSICGDVVRLRRIEPKPNANAH